MAACLDGYELGRVYAGAPLPIPMERRELGKHNALRARCLIQLHEFIENERGDSMNKRNTYSTPELKTYGSVRELTEDNKIGANADIYTSQTMPIVGSIVHT